jgi:hypothetical protein
MAIAKARLWLRYARAERYGLFVADQCFCFSLPRLTGDQQVVGVIDIDCAELEGFDEEDQKGLEAIADLLGKSSDW